VVAVTIARRAAAAVGTTIPVELDEVRLHLPLKCCAGVYGSARRVGLRLRDLLRRARRAPTLQTAVAVAGSQVLMALAGVVSARALGPVGKGVVTGVTTWPQLLAWIGSLGLPSAASLRLAAERDSLPVVLGNAAGHALTVGGAVALLAMATLAPALGHLGAGAAALARWNLAFIPLGMLASILMAINLALGRIRRHNACLLLQPAILVLGVMLLAVSGQTTAALLVWLTIVSSLVSLSLAGHGLPWRLLAVNLGQLRDDLRFGIRVQAGALLGMANLRLDLLLMSLLLPAGEVGLYGTANNAMLPVMAASSGASLLLTPAVARLGAGSHPQQPAAGGQLAAVRREARRHLLVALAAGALLAAVAPVLIGAVFSAAFSPAVTLIRILIPGYVARAFAAVVTAGAVGMRKPWVGNCSEACGLVVTLTLLPLLLPRYGALGAAWTSTCAYAAAATVAVLALRRLAHVRSPAECSAPDRSPANLSGGRP
jgi:O-antigen/teichoic acid export membrane protein